MTLALPLWGWAIAALAILASCFVAYGCGYTNGEAAGVDLMKRAAILVGFAKACDFDGGWRWYSREEIAAKVRAQQEGQT